MLMLHGTAGGFDELLIAVAAVDRYQARRPQVWRSAERFNRARH